MKKLEKLLLKYCNDNNILLTDNRVYLSENNKNSANVFFVANCVTDNHILEFIIDKFDYKIIQTIK